MDPFRCLRNNCPPSVWRIHSALVRVGNTASSSALLLAMAARALTDGPWNRELASRESSRESAGVGVTQWARRDVPLVGWKQRELEATRVLPLSLLRLSHQLEATRVLPLSFVSCRCRKQRVSCRCLVLPLSLSHQLEATRVLPLSSPCPRSTGSADGCRLVRRGGRSKVGAALSAP